MARVEGAREAQQWTGQPGRSELPSQTRAEEFRELGDLGVFELYKPKEKTEEERRQMYRALAGEPPPPPDLISEVWVAIPRR